MSAAKCIVIARLVGSFLRKKVEDYKLMHKHHSPQYFEEKPKGVVIPLEFRSFNAPLNTTLDWVIDPVSDTKNEDREKQEEEFSFCCSRCDASDSTEDGKSVPSPLDFQI